MTEDPDSHGESLEEIAVLPVRRRGVQDAQPRPALTGRGRGDAALRGGGEAMIVEGGLSGTQLFVLRDGTLDFCAGTPWSP